MLGDPIIRYYIEWQGPKTIKEIFKRYPGSENSLDQTLFYAKYGDGGRGGTKERNAQYDYNQFQNSEFEHLEFLGRRLGGPTGRNQLGVNPDKALYSGCLCSNCKKSARNTSVQ